MKDTRVDYLVIGSGIAGLWFAWKAGQKGKVLIVTKKDSPESNTNYAQGGIAAAVAEDDDPKLHYEDTIRVGAGLAHPDVVQMVTEAGPRLVQELWKLGVNFSVQIDSQGKPKFDLGQEGGHRRRRIIHSKDATGYEIEQGLLKAVRSLSNVQIWEEHFTVDLLLDSRGNFTGAEILEKSTREVKLVWANAGLLATGGIGQVYRHTTNPAIATGDGIAMAFRAGATIANMEFIQFHPTTLYGHKIDDRVFLISEAVRGEGAVLKTRDGKEFMNAYHPDGSLAPRDVVARAIAAELSRRGDEYVLLDCTGIPEKRLRERFPNIYETCLGFGIDISREPIPVVPAAHYVCGGVVVNSWGETTISRLYAAGECACTGLHGANRLASNSLLEALVFAERAAINATNQYSEFTVSQSQFHVPKRTGIQPCSDFVPKSREPKTNDQEPGIIINRLRNIMWRDAGIVRSDQGLLQAEQELNTMIQDAVAIGRTNSVKTLEMRNMLLVSQLIVACARRRSESRGLHYNQDHPLPEERYERDTIISRQDLEPFS